MDNVQIRKMKREELPLAVEWAVAEGWNPGLADAECFWLEDPDGFFCAEVDGKMAGSVSVLNYDDRFAFAGLYIVKPEYRGRGIGMQLYRHAMRHAGSRIVGGDGVVAMVEKYEKDGGLFFHYNNARYEGKGGGLMPKGLTPVQKVKFADLLEYDTAHFPARREKFPPLLDRQRRTISGLPGWTRTGRSSATVSGGPATPDTRSGRSLHRTARLRSSSLTGSLQGSRASRSSSISPCRTRRQSRWSVDRKMVPVFHTARLYSTRDPVPLPLEEIFGVTTFELG